jgi:hypothetical protein
MKAIKFVMAAGSAASVVLAEEKVFGAEFELVLSPYAASHGRIDKHDLHAVAMKKFFGKDKEGLIHPYANKCEDEHCKCMACALGGARWLVGQADRKIMAWCESEDSQCKESDKNGCHHKEEWCKFYTGHHDVGLGFIAEEMHVMGLGFAYCSAPGQPCHKDDGSHYAPEEVMMKQKPEQLMQLNSIIETGMLPELKDFSFEGMIEKYEFEEEEKHMAEMASEEHMPLAGFVIGQISQLFEGAMFGTKMEKLEVITNDKDIAAQVKEEKEMAEIAVPKMKGICPRCYKKTFMMVMKKAVWGVKQMCEKTKCPVMQGWCKWAGEHKEMAFGVILAKVEPWKYAIGRCWHPDHGPHHGPHGGPHHWGPPGPHGHRHHPPDAPAHHHHQPRPHGDDDADDMDGPHGGHHHGHHRGAHRQHKPDQPKRAPVAKPAVMPREQQPTVEMYV